MDIKNYHSRSVATKFPCGTSAIFMVYIIFCLMSNNSLHPQDCVLFGEFMQTLRTSPHLLAACLAAGDRLMPEAMPNVINTLYGGLFGSCLLPEDKLLVLRLLRHLTQIQLVPSENPRRCNNSLLVCLKFCGCLIVPETS